MSTTTNDATANHTRTGLFQTERQSRIAAQANADRRVEVSELAMQFGVTTETIRRDLSDLQELKVVRRVHGGAVPWENDTNFEPLLAVRDVQNESEKRRLADVAIAELPDSGTVIIDSGSTLSKFAEVFPTDGSVRAITNSLVIAQTLVERSRSDVIVLGGQVRKNTFAMVDAQTVADIETMRVDTLFISGDGVTARNGLSTPYREEAALKRAMVAAARRVIAVLDHSKFGHEHLNRYAEWSDVDVLITNFEAPPGEIEAIESTGTTVTLA